MLFKLTINILKNNRKRTLVTILGIMLSSALLFGIGLMVSTIRDNGIKEATMNYGPHHIEVQNITPTEKKKIDKQTNIKDLIYVSFIDRETKTVSDSVVEQLELNLYGYTEEYKNHIKLSSGRFARNHQEIIVPRNLFENFELKLNDLYQLNNKKYKIVGVYDSATYMNYNYYRNLYHDQYELYTGYQNSNHFIAYITFDSNKNIRKQIADFTENIGRDITYEHDNIHYQDIIPNISLIDYYSPNLKGGTMAVLILSIVLIGSVLGLFCIFVIYNSFAISVMERKKLFGILSSIGANKTQILQSVFMEALLVSIIGIPLGFLISLGLTGSVIAIINTMVGEFITIQYQLSIYPLFMLVSLLLIIIVVILSAYRPAKQASLISPIEAIRLNKDYHFNKRTLKSSKFIKKLFGIEGELAYLNLKRNKRKYRVTTISIVISIILFLVFSTYINFGIKESEKNINADKGDYNIRFYIDHHPNIDEFYTKLKALPEIKEIISSKSVILENEADNRTSYTKEYQNYINRFKDEQRSYITKFLTIVTIDTDKYQDLTKKYRIKDDMPIFVNHSKIRIYSNDTGQLTEIKDMTVLKENSKMKFRVCYPVESKNCDDLFPQIYVTNDILYDNLSAPSVLVSDRMYQDIITNYLDTTRQSYAHNLAIFIKSDSYKKLDDSIQNLITEYPELNISYENYNMQNYELNMQFFTIQLILYTLLGFISLIAITSMFNTIYTSMELRRGEFATLRSIGIEPFGFKKMILLESIFFGIKALIYGLIISLLLIFGIEKIFGLSYGSYKLTIPFPTTYILFTVIAVIFIITITMFYSIRKIKDDNIIDTIRNESI